MKLLTLLPFQAFVIAFLCSSALAEERAATLDELIRALGSLYQQKLFVFRDEDVGAGPHAQTRDKDPEIADIHENVSLPRFEYCWESIPLCVALEGFIAVRGKNAPWEGKRQSIRNRQDQLCMTNINLGTCSDIGLMGDYKEIVSVSGLSIPDFCFPGDIKLAGQVEFFDKITSNATVTVQMIPNKLSKRTNKYYEPASCSQITYFYKVCDLLDRSDNCARPRKDQDVAAIPCTCDIDKGIYDMGGFVKTVRVVDFFGMGERSGFAVVTSGEDRSCFSFSFTGALGTF